MGREIKRVPLDFNHPLKEVWGGFINPYYKYSHKCPFCNGTGLNEASKQIDEDWYDFAGTGRRWSDALTQDEVDTLITEGRLKDFTHRFVKGQGWQPTGRHPTAAEINATKGMVHDSINKWICVKARCEQLGVWGDCEHCKGEGELWLTPAHKQQCEDWEQTEPPTGDGYQVWETVSEGSPVSPVFATPEALGAWLTQQGYSSEAARKFIEVGHVFSMVSVGGKLYNDIESAKVMGDKDAALDSQA